MKSIYRYYYETYGANPPAGIRQKNRPNLKIACILNESMANDLQYECELLPLAGDNWKEQLILKKPEFLLCEPILGERSKYWTDSEFKYKEITLFCRACGIPTVFWDTLSSSIFNKFRKAAMLFDHLFVTNFEDIALYRELGKPDAHFLPSGVQIMNISPVRLGGFQEQDTPMTRAALQLLRENIAAHAYSRRIGLILDTIGVRDDFNETPGVTILTATNKVGYMKKIFDNYDRQTYRQKEMVVILNNDSLNLDVWKARAALSKDVQIIKIDEKEPLGYCLNYGIENSRYPYITKMDDDNYYAPEFLTDLMNTHHFANADIVGKLSYYVYLKGGGILLLMCPGMENRYVNFVSGSALIIRRDVFDRVKFSDVPQGSDSVFLNECVKKGVTIYSADRYNYIYERRSSKKEHTYQISDEVYLQSCQYIGKMADPNSFITV